MSTVRVLLVTFDSMGESNDKHNRKGVKTSYVSTIIGISLVLFVIGIVVGGFAGLEKVQKQAKESLVCDLFFEASLNDSDIKQVEQELKTWDEFKEVEYISPDRALAVFGEGDQNSENILSIYEGENPLPATVSFKPKEQYATIDGLEEIQGKLLAEYGDVLEDINYDEESVREVNLGFKQFVYLIGAIALLLIIVAFAMINNTIRLALYSRRFSIKTMQLVGATSGYIRRPFLFQSFGIGIVSGTIGMALVLLSVFAFNNIVSSIVISMDLIFFLILYGVLLVIGIVITLISTWMALNKYLRMKLDDLY